MAFLTELDSRAAVKGSRDPLGFVPVWSRFGRRVVGNLTTVSNSVRGFTTLLLGYYLAELIQEGQGREAGTTLELFLKFEQLAAYSRYFGANDKEFRGIERVAARLSEGTTVQIGASRDLQILSNQKIYGLWGLFSVPATNSGLLTPEGHLTAGAREHVEGVLIPALASRDPRAPDTICNLLARESVRVRLDSTHASVVDALCRALRPRLSAAEKSFYRDHLAHGSEDDATRGLQQQLATLLSEDPEAEFDMLHLGRTIEAARKQGWVELERDLTAISAIEPLLIACEQVFSLLCASDRETPEQVATFLRTRWTTGLAFLKLDHIREDRQLVVDAYNDSRMADRLLEIAEALRAGDFTAAVLSLLSQNEAIMTARGGRPWVEHENGHLKVHFFDDDAPSPSERRDLPQLWRNTYFINSLKRVARTVAAS